VIPSSPFLIAAVAFVAGCSDAPPGDEHGARLHVQQVIAKGSPLPIEGAYAYIRVEQPGGSKVVERRLKGAAKPSATVELAAGRYRLLSWQRTCDGNCGYLDPPSDQCSEGFEVRHDQGLAATVTVRYGSGCRIEFG
jgi:hypothetical protein